MSKIVYRIFTLLQQILASVPVGTNLGLFHLLWALLSGRFLLSRGAVFPALAALGLSDDAVRRSDAALRDGHFDFAKILASWNKIVLGEGHWRVHCYEGIEPVSCDLVGFFRPRLVDCASKHYRSEAAKALPALPYAIITPVGSVGGQRLGLLKECLRLAPNESEADLQRRALRKAGQDLTPLQALIVDAGFPLADLLACGVDRFVTRAKSNATFRRNYLPKPKKLGRPCEYGEKVRPRTRTHDGKKIPATPADATARWKDAEYTLTARIYNNLVASEAKPGSPPLRCVVIDDPRYKEELVLVTNLMTLSAYALWRLYKDRWPIEQLPLAAKSMLGAERSFVFGKESRWRLPELALLAGNVLSYVAATATPMATGFWDRRLRPTCGRLRRLLMAVDFSKLALPEGELRKKQVVTAHLPKGVKGHRRQKAPKDVLKRLKRAA